MGARWARSAVFIAALALLLSLPHVAPSPTSGEYGELGEAEQGGKKLWMYCIGGVVPAAASTIRLSQIVGVQWTVQEFGAADHGGGMAVRMLKLVTGKRERGEMDGGTGSGGKWEEVAPAPQLVSDVEHALGYDALMRSIGERQQCINGQGREASAQQCAAHQVLYQRVMKDIEWFVKAGVKPTVQELFDAVVAKSDQIGAGSDFVFVQVVDNKLYCVRMPRVEYYRPTGVLHSKAVPNHACFPDGEDRARDWGVLRLVEKTLRVHKVPDMAFAFHSADGPRLMILPRTKPDPHLVILSMAKTDNYADIIFPGHSFSENSYNTFWEDWHTPTFQRDVLDKRYAWGNKKKKLFWRGCDTICDVAFSMGPDVMSKKNADVEGWADSKFWQDMIDHTSPLKLRNMYAAATDQHAAVLDVRITDGNNASFVYADKVSMMDHAAYTYLAHFDGATYSSRFMKLLLMNSAVFKMHSYVYEYFYDALVPDEHYVEFKFLFGHADPVSDLLAKVQWAERNPEHVRQIAANGRKFALQHLTIEGAMCYWRELLLEIGEKLTSGDASQLLPGAERFDLKTSCARCYENDVRNRKHESAQNLVPEK